MLGVVFLSARLRSPQALRPAAAALLVFFAAQGIFLIGRTSPTTDEVAFHTVNGYTYLKTRDFRMNPASPALPRMWMALPWLFWGPKLDLDKASWREADSVPFARDFFYKDNRAAADKLLYSSRAMVLLLGVLLGGAVFVWSRALHGNTGGLLSLLFYCSTPLFIAHSSLATTDTAIALSGTLAAWGLWRYLEAPSARRLALTAAALGLAAAVKFNALVFLPLFPLIIWARRGPAAALRAGLVFAAAAFLMVWASYFFETKPLLADGVPRIEEKQGLIARIVETAAPGQEGLKASALEAAMKQPIPIPTYLLGIVGILRLHRSPYLHFAFGEWTTRVHWYYYSFVFLIKMTLPFLALLVLRAALLKRTPASSRNADLVIGAPVLAYFVFLCSETSGHGIRYAFPVLPLLFVWIGGAAPWLTGSAPRRLLLAGLAAVQLYSCLGAFPDPLSYFNALIGGPKNAHHYVRDSDLDWGQGLKPLARYLEKRGIRSIGLIYFGTADPSFYGIGAEAVTDAERKKPAAKVYAVSAHYLEALEWTRRLRPDTRLGGIYVYDLRAKSGGPA